MKEIFAKTITEQFKESPVGSVLVIRYKDAYCEAIVKTGLAGYKAAYRSHDGFLNADDGSLARVIDSYKDDKPRYFLLFDDKNFW